MNTFTLFVLLLLSAEVTSGVVKRAGNAFGICYKDWSSCTSGTDLHTGILWKTCREFCRECLGGRSGRCDRSKMSPCGRGYFCPCLGGSRRKAKDEKTVLECKHKL